MLLPNVADENSCLFGFYVLTTEPILINFKYVIPDYRAGLILIGVAGTAGIERKKSHCP
jgi:hypothetical protein